MEPTNLTEYKKLRKLKRVTNELAEIEKLLSLILKGLNTYKKYTPVKDILKNVLENKALINVYYKKYKNVLDRIDENKQNKLE